MPGQLDQLVERLRKALGPDLVSVILYGSAAVGDHNEKFSGLQYPLRPQPDYARAAPARRGRFSAEWREQGNPAPLFLTGSMKLLTSTDCFAIEFPGHRGAPSHPVRRRRRFLP